MVIFKKDISNPWHSSIDKKVNLYKLCFIFNKITLKVQE